MIVTVRREPKRETIGPESGSAGTEPAAIASSTRPSADGSRSRPFFTCGMRAAQLEKANPVAMNAAYVARMAASTARRSASGAAATGGAARGRASMPP
jgi:hypothetical protein